MAEELKSNNGSLNIEVEIDEIEIHPTDLPTGNAESSNSTENDNSIENPNSTESPNRTESTNRIFPRLMKMFKSCLH